MQVHAEQCMLINRPAERCCIPDPGERRPSCFGQAASDVGPTTATRQNEWHSRVWLTEPCDTHLDAEPRCEDGLGKTTFTPGFGVLFHCNNVRCGTNPASPCYCTVAPSG